MTADTEDRPPLAGTDDGLRCRHCGREVYRTVTAQGSRWAHWDDKSLTCARRTYTVAGIWIGDRPVPVAVIEGDHEVGGGEQCHEWAGPWAERVRALNVEQAEALAVAAMLATLDDDGDES